MSKKTYRIALSGLLVSAMMILSYIENLIPLPIGIPGVKLGLANSVLLFALYMMGTKQAIVLMLVKVGLSSLLFGFTMLPYSAAGAILSLLGMILIHKIKGVNIITVSIVGAVLHNIGQLIMAALIGGTPNILYYLAVLIIAAVITGAVTGIVAQIVIGRLGKNQKRIW